MTVPKTKYVSAKGDELPFHDYNFGKFYWRVDYTAAANINVGFIEYSLDISFHKPGPIEGGKDEMSILLPNPGVVNNASSNYTAANIFPALTSAVIAANSSGAVPLAIDMATGLFTVLENMYLDVEVARSTMAGATSGNALGMDGFAAAQGTANTAPSTLATNT